MIGMMYDFEAADIRFDDFGAIEKAVIDNQNCALIATSEVCRITRPEVGAYLFARVINRQAKDVKQLVADARRMVEADGGKQVYLTPVLDDHGRVANVTFKADYGEPYVLVDNSVVLTYILDYATPGAVRKRYEKGTVVTLQSPGELGFALPSTHSFQAWTYVGQDVTQVTVLEDMVVEGRVDRLPGANLLRGTRLWSPFSASTSSPSGADLAALASTTYAKIVTGSDYNYLELYAPSSNSLVTFARYPRLDAPINSVYVLSFIAVNTSAAATVSFSGASKVFLDGVKQATASVSLRTNVEHVIEAVYERVNNSDNFFRCAVGTAYSRVRFILPKLEDVTGLPEEEQRATTWVPHVDDAI